MPGLMDLLTSASVYGGGKLDEYGLLDRESYLAKKPRERALAAQMPQVDAPRQFRPDTPPTVDPTRALDLLRASTMSEPAAVEDAPVDQMAAARRGFTVDPNIDWAAEREGFLGSRGGGEMVADDYEPPEGFLFSSRGNDPTAPGGIVDQRRGEEATELALGGLRRAGARDERSFADTSPAALRRNRGLDATSAAESFMSPTVTRARGVATDEGVGEQQQLGDLALRLGADPRALEAERRKFSQQKELYGINAQGRSGLAGLLMQGQQGGNTSAPRGTAPTARAVTEAEIRARGAELGASEQDIQDTLADARAAGALR